MVDEHKIKLEQLYGRVRSSSKGLSSIEAEKRVQEQGFNRLESKRKLTFIIKFLKQFTNFFALLLFAGAVLAIIADVVSPNQGNLYIGIALFAVVLLNAIFTFIQEYRSERIMEKFKDMLPLKAEVLRDGRRSQILAQLLVPGDIIFLNEGDKVPADARLIAQSALKVDHSSITGESEPQLRTVEWTHDNILESRNVVFSGTLVQSGDGTAVVYGTGSNTQIGKIVALTEGTSDVVTPLHKELTYFIRIISILAIILGVLFFAIGYTLHLPLIGSLIFAIGIIVANVPEGLLPTVTLALSIASKRMAKKNALIRHLESVETLGSTTVICTDKTGTLTENKMAMSTVYVDLEEVPVSAHKFPSTASFDLLLKAMILCNNAQSDADKKSFIGDPTETALLDFAQLFMDFHQLSAKQKRVHEIPFDSRSKHMITFNKVGSQNLAYLKGAPEVVLHQCDRIQIQGTIRRLTNQTKLHIDHYYKKLASRGERVLAFGYTQTKTTKVTQDNFIFLGLVGMIDPARPEVPDAIKKCKSAGIRVIMITGDHSLTAEALARRIGLISDTKAAIVTGDELEHMDETRLKQVLKKENLIFARTTPKEKLRIVQALQSMGEVVTVTGDGVNDAPALKNADMGVAMGLGGTEVAREASDMILMDNNFATIINAIEEGRTIFDNIKKFITYILTSNVPEIIPFIVFALFNLPLALTVILILCIDLGTDMLPAIGLGSEKPEDDVMHLKPRSRQERLLTKAMLVRGYLYFGLMETVGAFFAFFVILYHGGWHWGQQLASGDPLYIKAVTAYFAAVVVCQVANMLICRARREPLYKIGFFSNKLVWLGVGVELALLCIIVYLPYTHPFFGTSALSWWELLLGVPFAGFMIFVDGMRKFFLRRKFKWVEEHLSW